MAFPWEEVDPAFAGFISPRTQGYISGWPGAPQIHLRASNPPPVPWLERSVAFLLAAVSSQVAAKQMSTANASAAQQIIAAETAAIAAFIDSDDICPRWPWPGPPPWLSVIASELTLVANTLQAGDLQTGILQVAGQVLDRAQALTPGAAGGTAGSASTS
jgi:hypothetical protein